MEYLYKNKIDSIDISPNNKSHDHLINNMVEMFYQKTISNYDNTLLKFSFQKEITQDSLDSFLQKWDIEACGSKKALMLAYVMKENPNLKFSEYEAPRLSGLLNYFRFSNLKLISHFTKVSRALNDKDIYPLLIKGGAMRYVRPEYPRVMGDIDIVTTGDDFFTACNIAKDLGYNFDANSTDHSVDLHVAGSQAGTLDIHKYINFESSYDISFMDEIVARGSKVNAFGAKVIVPCFEDMLFIALSNLSKNLHNNTSSDNMLYVLFDCKFLINNKKDFDWDIIVNNANKTNSIVSIYFAMRYLNRIIPGILPENLLNKLSVNKDIEDYCNKVIYQRFYIQDLKMRCKKLKLKHALCNVSVLKQYLRDKPKHFVLKRIKKNKHLVSLFLWFVNNMDRK